MCPRFETKRISLPSGDQAGLISMIELAVVIAREGAAVLSGQTLDIFQFAVAELSHENMEVSVERRGDECDPLAVGRETGLDVDGAASRELARCFCLQIQGPEFDCIPGVRGVNHPASVGRAIGLVVIAGAAGQLLGRRRVELLLPQRSCHGVHHAAGIRGPRHRARARS